jgi:hypothetical protein
MTRLFGDAIVAGRVVSLVAFACWAAILFAAARRMRCSPAESLFGAVLFVAYTLAFSAYVGIDDPEFLAHAVQGVGLVLLLRDLRSGERRGRKAESVLDVPLTRGRILAVAACFAAGVFVKHNAIALPLAATAWLMVVDRPNGWRLAASGAAFGVAGAAICTFVFGDEFVAGVMMPRTYSLSGVVASTVRWAIRMPVFLAALVVLCRRAPRDRHVWLCALYAAIGTAAGLLMLGGANVDWNVMFDSNAAFCLSAALAFNRLKQASGPLAQARRLWLAGAYVAVILVAVLAAARRQWGRADYWLARDDDVTREAARDVAFLAGTPGPVMCENLALCYWAGKRPEVDVFSFQQRVRLGWIDPRDLQTQIDGGYFAAIQLGALEQYFDPRILDALSRAYVRYRSDRFGVFLVRRETRPATDR